MERRLFVGADGDPFWMQGGGMSSINKAALSFVHDLDALREVLPPVMFMAMELKKQEAKAHLESLERLGNLLSERDGVKQYSVPMENAREVDRVDKKHQRAETATRLLPRTFLVSFVSTYDAFLGQLITALLETKPEILNGSARQLTFKELTEFPDIDSARAHMLEMEVDAVMRDSHADQFKWLEKTFNVKLREGLASWSTFIELTERRSLFVHCHGKVSSQYLRVCDNNKAAISGVGLGDTLGADNKYLVSAYKCLYEIGIKLSQVLWRKVRPGELLEADQALNSYVYELLCSEKYDLATRLLEFAVDVLPQYGSEETKRIFVVNLAQAYKFSGKEKECLDRLSAMDWSACGDNFAICVAVLRDDFEGAAKVMEKVGSNGAVRQQDYLDWPVFRKFRESDQFKRVFAVVFGKEPASLKTHKTPQLEESAEA